MAPELFIARGKFSAANSLETPTEEQLTAQEAPAGCSHIQQLIWYDSVWCGCGVACTLYAARAFNWAGLPAAILSEQLAHEREAL